MNLEKIKKAYFIGIGGIGMSAIARYFKQKNIEVSGYDKTPTVLTHQLEKEGVKIHFEENIEMIPKDADVVIYTPAIPGEHIELKFFKENNYLIKKRSDILQEITKDFFTIAIAGTHGKTTVSSMISHILKHSGYDCTAFLGGIALNFNSNFVNGKNETMVVEADEYDRSFLKLNPNIGVITATDADHLDIYGTEEKMQGAYIEFAGKIKSNGLLVTKFNLPILKEVNNENIITYSFQDSRANYFAKNIKKENGGYIFDVIHTEQGVQNVRLNIGGLHNVENTVVAIAIAQALKIDNDKIKKAIFEFKGVQRRFEYKIKTKDFIFIDDYAHHPQEIKALISSVKELYPEKKITAIFQPHLFSRTRDLADGFVESLNLADEVILLDIYPARELLIEGVSSKMLYDKLSVKEKLLCSKNDLLDVLKNKKTGVLLTIGAGDIDQLIEPIRKIYE